MVKDKDFWLVSVVLTLYNKAPYIEETIFSVYKQTYTNWELIIVDDCSTDWSLEIAKSFCKKIWITNKCIFIRNEKNLRVGKTFEKWLKEAHGDWIAMCDWDDILIKNKLEENIKYCTDNNKDFCYSDFIGINENNQYLYSYKQNFLEKCFFRSSCCYKDRIILNEAFWSSIFFNKKVREFLIKDWCPYDVPQDYRAIEAASLHNCKFGRINKPLYYYRRCGLCISINFDKSIMQAYEEMIKRRYFSTNYIIENLKFDKSMMERFADLNIIDEKIFEFIKSDKKTAFNLLPKIVATNLWIKYKLILIFEVLRCSFFKLFKE